MIPASEMLAMSYQQYDQFLAEHPKSQDTTANERLQRVGRRIADATEQYLRDNGLAHETAGYEWEFSLIDEPTVNAWAMPGGKIVVYAGMMPVAAGETGLAVVIGHEVAHVIAHHGNERMSQALLAQMGGTALNTALREEPEKTQQLWMTVFGAAAQYGVLLPYSRTQEYEADTIGLIIMAKAGYDPRAAPGFFERLMQASANKKKPLVFLSTHPADEDRIARIKSLIPEAMKYYKP